MSIISEWEDAFNFNFDEEEPDLMEELRAKLKRKICISPEYHGGYSRPLIEVFSVRIMNICCNIYGTITVNDGTRTQYLYNRKREESEFIGPENTLLLIGPARAFSGYGSIEIDVHLMDKDKDLPLVRNGLMLWTFLESCRNVYNYPLLGEVEGDYGPGYGPDSVTVNYIALSKAVEATVTVTLIIGNGEDPSNVYGRITASNSNFSEESLLFRKGSNERIDVRSGQLIPLSRSVVAVQLGSFLIVRADLWDITAISSNVIAKGTAEFASKFTGTFEKSICSQGSEIRVKVTWS